MNSSNFEGIDGPRPPRPSERDELIDFLNSVFRSFSTGEGIEERWAPIYDEGNLPNVRVIRIQDRIVASAATWITDTAIGDATLRIGGLNLVGTHKEYRRRGLATLVLEACVEHLRQSGCQLSLLRSALDDWYRKQGWESAASKRAFHLDRGNRGLVESDASLGIRPALDSDFDALAQIRHASGLGSIRDAETAGIICRRPARRTLVGERGGALTAYVHGLAGRRASIQEHSGPSRDVLSLIRAYYDSLDDPATPTSTPAEEFTRSTLHLEVQAPGFADGAGDALAELGIPAAAEYVGMWRILDLEGLLGCYADSGITGRFERDEVALARGGIASRYSPAQAVKALFGPERPGEFARSTEPLPLWQWESDIV